MCRIILSVFILVLLSSHNIVESPDPDQKTDGLMGKEEVLKFLSESVKEMFDPMSESGENPKTLKRYIKMVKSLTFCMGNKDISKPELVTCLNNVISEGGIIPPDQLLSCIGEYMLCTGRECLGKIKSGEDDKDLITCLVECLPMAILCVTRSRAIPERFDEL